MLQAADFGNQPGLIGSRGGPAVEPVHAVGTLRPGDRLLLLTDALAQWFLQTQEGGDQAVKGFSAVLCSDQPDEAFIAWIEQLRDKNGLRNDDVTLLAVESTAHAEKEGVP